MEIIFSLGQASVFDVLDALPDPPSYSAVRTVLRLLEEKGQLKHRKSGRKYIYLPTVAPAQARRSALTSLLNTFFDGSVELAVASLLDLKAKKLSDPDLDRLEHLIDEARERGKTS